MYYLVIRQFARTLKNLDACLAKAQKYAEGRGFDVNNMVQARLAPDMLPFVAQIRIACDNAKMAAANLSGKPAPKHEDTETTFEELRGRIGKALAFIDTLSEADFAKVSADQTIKLQYPPGKGLRANDYIVGRQIPNFYFHVATAYDILRSNGVDIGKGDYLGDLPLIDA
ncbi:MAG TPA: DUF1993 domain-containing protein [Polyangiaceae bacterium]|nr:DUF1993 domain-containing protein [Polyangiaceae bacterium]